MPVVTAPVDHFKISSSAASDYTGAAVAWAAGTAGTVESLPANFTHRFAVYSPQPTKYGSSPGVTAAVEGWGKLMTKLYNTSRVKDISLEKLEYQTDNGAQVLGVVLGVGQWSAGTRCSTRCGTMERRSPAAPRPRRIVRNCTASVYAQAWVHTSARRCGVLSSTTTLVLLP